jgi:hypothetical protein
MNKKGKYEPRALPSSSNLFVVSMARPLTVLSSAASVQSSVVLHPRTVSLRSSKIMGCK